MLDFSQYTFSWYAVPTAVTTVLLAGLGCAVLIRERASSTSLLFLALVASVSIWLFSFSVMYCAEPAWLALRWAKAAYLGVPFIPSAIYHFTASVLGISRRHRPLIWINWLVSALFAGTIIGTDALIHTLYEYWWGHYPGYGWLSVPYLTFFFGTMILSLRLYWRAYRRSAPGTIRYQRTRLLLIAFSIIYLGSFDYVAKYGVALYPFGYLPVLWFVALTAYAIWKYRLIDLTPAFAARQISDTMVNALIVIDHDGIIRIVNHATCELFGQPDDRLIGQRLALPTQPLLTQELLAGRLREGPVRDYELTLPCASGNGPGLTLSLSASVIVDESDRRRLGTVCVLNDITARKRAEQDVRLLHDATLAVSACADFPSALGTVVRLVCDATGWDCGEAWIPDAQGLRWCDAAWHARNPRLEAFRTVSSTVIIPYGAGLAGHAADTGRPEWIADLAEQEQRLYSRRARLAITLDLRSTLAVPIIWEGEVLAVLGFFMRQPRTEEPHLIHWVSSLATQLGLVMARKRAEEALRRARNDLERRVFERTEELAAANRALQAYVDELKHAEQEVRESEVRFRTMANAAPVMIWMAGLDKACTYVNTPWLEFSGRTLPQVLGEGWVDSVHPEDREQCLLMYQSAFEVREAFRLEFRLRRHDGEYRWILASGAPRFTAEGGFIGYIGSCIDITDRKQAEEDIHRSKDELERRVQKRTEELAAANRALESDIAERIRAEQALHESEARFRSLAQSAMDAIISADSRGLVKFCNPAAETMFGYAKPDLLGQPLTRLMPERYREQHAAGLRRAGQGEHRLLGKVMELHGLRSDGTEFPLELSLSTWNIGSERFYTAIMRDVTERTHADDERRRAHAELQRSHEELKQAHLQLIQAAKMESVGRLAAGVAHEVKNPLAVILQGVDYLSRHIPKEDGNSSIVLKHTADAVRRADAVIRGLLNFSATRELEVAPADVHAVLEQALLLVKHEFDRGRITVAKSFARRLPPVQLDVNKMEQVFVNLFMNAAQAMPEGGALTVHTAARRMTRVSHDVGARSHDRFRIGDDVVIIEVDDTGGGIPDSAMDKIFDPFFTTKPTGKGTGLGLTVTKKIVELHGGILNVANRAGGGVRATVVLRAGGGNQNGQSAHSPH